MTKTVLLTGISGFIGLHSAKELLNQGYIVRGSVRSKRKEQQVRDTLTVANVDVSNLTIVELDLASDKGWDEAAAGADYIMHVASPFLSAAPKHEDEIIVPAVQGTLRAMRAAKNASIKRVVLTSSAGAMFSKLTGEIGPKDWTDTNAPKISAYLKSKTLAERAAWDFMKNEAAGTDLELTVIAPGATFGPPVGDDISGTALSSIARMLSGKMPMVPKVAMPMGDVRDVATLHVKALETPQAAGQRFLVADAPARSFQNIAQILKDEGHTGPSTRLAPNLLMRLMAVFDKEARGMVGWLGLNLSGDISATRRIFGWTPISFRKTLSETAVKISGLQS
ncbi:MULTISPECIES: NAD-dependent epimerase/dehydratase family protein [Alphaproteobacteria]|uniref:NAD-dependent epimerase/dehydratase family protein n=1 Tax=Alphaproteobacteria TaxID=28211 RepID=UPI003A8DB9A7